MVEHPAECSWSGYRCNDQGVDNALLSPHPLYKALGQSKADCCRRYRALFRAHLEPGLIDEIRRATSGIQVPGNARFSKETELMQRRRVTPGESGRPLKN
jgi:putative transposase